MLKKYPHSSGDKRRAILRWGTKMVVSTSKPPPPCTPNQQAIANYNKFIANYSKLYPGGPIPQNMAKTFDGPPTLERSGSEHRRAVYILPSEEEGLVRGGALLAGETER